MSVLSLCLLMGWINTDWETYLTAKYQTDSQLIKYIQHSLKNFIYFYKEPFLQWSLTYYIIHRTAVEMPGLGSIQNWDAPRQTEAIAE